MDLAMDNDCGFLFEKEVAFGDILNWNDKIKPAIEERNN